MIPDYGEAIIKRLKKLEATGQMPYQIFDDWLELTQACFDMLPLHAQATAATGRMAEDTPVVKEIWKRLQGRYTRPEYWEYFAEAYALLLDSAAAGWHDTLGQIYQEYAYPNPNTGQFFTPWPVAEIMASMIIDKTEIISMLMKRLAAAVEKNPAAEAMLLAGAILEGEEATKWLLWNVLPHCINDFEPVKISDPAVGSGIMLLAAAKQLPSWAVQTGLVQFYGQDIDQTCVMMARINCRLYGLNGAGLQYFIMGAQMEAPNPADQPIALELPIPVDIDISQYKQAAFLELPVIMREAIPTQPAAPRRQSPAAAPSMPLPFK